MQTKCIGLIVGMLLLPLACFGQYTVSESGVWGATAPTTTWSAPNASWSYSFVVNTNPVVSNYSLGNNFTAAFSNFTYTLNGSPVATTPASIVWYSSALSGLFNINFSTASFFQIFGSQAYSGPENSPTILRGTYPINAGSFFRSSGNADQPLSGSVTISGNPNPVPALSQLGLIALAVTLLALGAWQLRRGVAA